TCNPVSGSTFPIGTTTVTCTAADAHGNVGTGSFTVTVTDTTGPSITVPANATVEATGPTGAAFSFTTTATDTVDSARVVTCTPADVRGNVGTGSFTVTVRDTTAPVVIVSANATVEATGPTGAAFSFATSATHIVDGALAVTCTPPSGATFAIGTTTVTCRATDARGNVGTKTFTVTVRDTTPPTLTLPANLVVDATSGAGAVVTYIASAVDTVDGSVAVTCVPASGATFAIGTTTVN